MDIKLAEKTAIVTGGSSGLGRCIVELLLSEGMNVATCGRSSEKLDRLAYDHQGDALYTRSVDVRDDKGMVSFVNDTATRFGGLDGVVANAGFGFSGNIFNTPTEAWTAQLTLKVMGVINLVMPAIPHLKNSACGRVVIINSTMADRPAPEMAAVCAARSAVDNLAKTLTLELASDCICVNTINLGVIDTERQKERHGASESSLNYADWQTAEVERRNIPFQRFGQAKEVAPFIALCLSPLCSYTTGSRIQIGGGL